MLLCQSVSERIVVKHPVGLALSAPFQNYLVETSSANLKNQGLDLTYPNRCWMNRETVQAVLLSFVPAAATKQGPWVPRRCLRKCPTLLTQLSEVTSVACPPHLRCGEGMLPGSVAVWGSPLRSVPQAGCQFLCSVVFHS